MKLLDLYSQSQHTHHTQIPRQLALIPHLRERRISTRIRRRPPLTHTPRDGITAPLHHLDCFPTVCFLALVDFWKCRRERLLLVRYDTKKDQQPRLIMYMHKTRNKDQESPT